MQTIEQLAVGERLVDKREMLERTGRSYVHIIKLMRAGQFPKPRDASGRPTWLDSDLTRWMRNLPPRPVRGDVGADELYRTQRENAALSAEARRRNLAKTRRENVKHRQKQPRQKVAV